MMSNLLLVSTVNIILVLQIICLRETNGFRRTPRHFYQNGKGIPIVAQRFQSLEAPADDFSTNTGSWRDNQLVSTSTADSRILFSLFSAKYPYSPIDGFHPEDEYYITDNVAKKVIKPFRPGFFTFSYPFEVPEGWKIYDPIVLGVSPPQLPADYNGITYKGYWYGCPSHIDLQDPQMWQWGTPNLFTHYCKYFYYF